jgi:hypothetical protein
MKKKCFLLIFMALLFTAGAVNAQEKYAVLLSSGQINDNYLPPNTGEEGWNDMFMMWELLQQKGFSTNNIFVLFEDGVDYIPYSSFTFYRPNPGETVTDGACNYNNIVNLFEGLADGNADYDKLEEDDFLFIWTYIDLDC